MISDLEALARKLCIAAGNPEDFCDELVYVSEPVRFLTPRGPAFGCIADGLRPLWMLWLHEATEVRRLAMEMHLRQSEESKDLRRT